MLIIPSCFKLFDKNVTAFFFLLLFPFYLLHIYPSVDFLSKYLTTSPEAIFSWTLRLHFYQFFVHLKVLNYNFWMPLGYCLKFTDFMY